MSDYKKLRSVLKFLREHTDSGYKKSSNITPIRVLKTRVWVETILQDKHISRIEFQRILHPDEPTGSVLRWLRGQQIVKSDTVDKHAMLSQLAVSIYHMPVFRLLEPTISRGELTQLFKQYTIDSPITRWAFDNLEPFILSENDRARLILVDDSDGLFRMGGVYGFIGILMLLRKAELDKDASRHFELMKDAYRAFPGFCRNRHFKSHWKEFLDALICIHGNMHTSSMLIKPRIGIIRQQIYAKEHITERSLRPRSPVDGTFIELEDPFVLAQFPN